MGVALILDRVIFFSISLLLPPEQIGAVESVKAASDIYSPVTGQITSVNDKLGDQPGLLNKSPEADGALRPRGRGWGESARVTY